MPVPHHAGCAIHPAKPKQCHTYPFWKENLRTRNHWELTAGFCPGIGQGPVIPPEEIKQRLKDFRASGQRDAGPNLLS